MAKRPYPGGLPISIIAGFSSDTLSCLKPIMEKAFRERTTAGRKEFRATRLFRYLEGDGRGQYQKEKIENFLKEFAYWISGQRENRAELTNPKHISFLYIPPVNNESHRKLLKYFVGFCRCEPLPELVLPHDFTPERICEEIRKVLGRMDLWSTKISAAHFTLPLRNFKQERQITALDLAIGNIIANPANFPLPDKILGNRIVGENHIAMHAQSQEKRKRHQKTAVAYAL